METCSQVVVILYVVVLGTLGGAKRLIAEVSVALPPYRLPRPPGWGSPSVRKVKRSPPSNIRPCEIWWGRLQGRYVLDSVRSRWTPSRPEAPKVSLSALPPLLSSPLRHRLPPPETVSGGLENARYLCRSFSLFSPRWYSDTTLIRRDASARQQSVTAAVHAVMLTVSAVHNFDSQYMFYEKNI